MTLPSTGAISLNDINNEFGRGTNLNSYRGTTWYTDAGSSGTFPSGAIDMDVFHGKRATSPAPTSFSVAVLGGGGGGQQVSFFGSQTVTGGGAGGGGQLRFTSSYAYTSGQTLTITVGGGGPTVATGTLTRGGDSSISGGSGGTITSTGGGPGQNGDGGNSYAVNSNSLYSNTPGTTTTNGVRGGCGTGGTPTTGYAGIGSSVTIGGTTYNVGGGGGGTVNNTTTNGFYWAPYPGYGGGSPGMSSGSNGTNGSTNTGGGGGGYALTTGSQYSYYNLLGGTGGSGLVVISYSDSLPAAATVTGNPTVTVSGGYRTYIFTQSGTLAW